MATKSRPDSLENEGAVNPALVRDPSYPDRARIDSDVRAFLRPASTPWIVFDRDSRVDDFAKSALRVGAVFASRPSYRPEVIKAAVDSGRPLDEIAALPLSQLDLARPVSITDLGSAQTAPDPFRAGVTLNPFLSSVLPDNGVFPPTSPESAVEPSSIVVSSDVVDGAIDIAVDAEARALSGVVRSRRARFAAIAGGVAGALAVVAALLVTGLPQLKNAPLTNETRAAAAKVEPAPPPAVAPVVVAKQETSPAPAEAPAVAKPASEPDTAKVPTDPHKRSYSSASRQERFGRLTLKGEATRKVVWFDGKRMLGNGQRTFMVYCGMHTVAVSDKADTKDVEIPCNGEYTVSK